MPVSEWDGSSLGRRRLLVVAEQGLGDTIWASRFLPELARYGNDITFACQKSLVPLFDHTALGSSLINMDDIEATMQHQHFDLKFPLMSMPRLLRFALGDVPYTRPYLRPSPANTAKWQPHIAHAKRPLIGLVWRGNTGQSNDRNRSIPLAALQPVVDAINGTLINLQIDIRDEEKQRLSATGRWMDPTQNIKDFSDTACLLEQLDLFVTVDTAAAHLAGALGRPTLLLRPHIFDWRWHIADMASPWYSSIEVFQQQPFGDWSGAINAVAARMRALTGGCSQ